MGKRHITVIEVEKYETLVIHHPRHSPRPVCQECSGKEPMLSPEEAAAIARVSLRVVFRWVETAQVHFCETADGQLYLCPGSLSRFQGEQKENSGEL